MPRKYVAAKPDYSRSAEQDIIYFARGLLRFELKRRVYERTQAGEGLYFALAFYGGLTKWGYKPGEWPQRDTYDYLDGPLHKAYFRNGDIRVLFEAAKVPYDAAKLALWKMGLPYRGRIPRGLRGV